MDYVNVSTILAFGKCDTRQCTEIPIVDDMIVEMNKSFFVTLERTSGLDSRIRLNPVEEEVEIINDDGVYIITLTWMYNYGNDWCMGITSQRLLWVWRGHPIQSQKMQDW